jgi:hypothetical protein
MGDRMADVLAPGDPVWHAEPAIKFGRRRIKLRYSGIGCYYDASERFFVHQVIQHGESGFSQFSKVVLKRALRPNLLFRLLWLMHG